MFLVDKLVSFVQNALYVVNVSQQPNLDILLRPVKNPKKTQKHSAGHHGKDKGEKKDINSSYLRSWKQQMFGIFASKI